METVFYKIDSKDYIFEQITNESKQYDVILSAIHSDKILWKNIFKNIIIEEIKGLYKMKNELFCFINNTIQKININNGNIIKINYLGNTPIEKIIMDKDCFYILLYYYEFDNNTYLSNVLCINKNFYIKWRAELFDKDDIYTNLIKAEKNITGYTWNGWRCIINKDTGKITDKRFIK